MVNGNNEGWSDFNNNHLAEKDEFYQLFPKDTKYNSLFEHCDRNLNIYGPAELVKPSSIDANGIPSFNV